MSIEFRINDIVRMINHTGDALNQGTVKRIFEDDTVYIKWDDDVKGLIATNEDVSQLFNVSHYNRENNILDKYQENYEKLVSYLKDNYNLDVYKISYMFTNSIYNENDLFINETFSESNIGDKIIEEYNSKIMEQLIRKIK